jgi:hypothetical protein
MVSKAVLNNVITVIELDVLYNCVPDLGYSCTGAVGSTSSCAIRCGDGNKRQFLAM